MFEMLGEGVTVTDEKTLLQTENTDLKKRIAALTVDRNAAYAKLKEMANDLAAKGDLLDVMTGANAQHKRDIQDMKVRHHAEIEKLRKSANDREMVALILGGIIGFVGAGLIIVMYFWIKSGWM